MPKHIRLLKCVGRARRRSAGGGGHRRSYGSSATPSRWRRAPASRSVRKLERSSTPSCGPDHVAPAEHALRPAPGCWL